MQSVLSTSGCKVTPVAWSIRNTRYLTFPEREPVTLKRGDVFITPEIFCEEERTGVTEWIKHCGGKCVAIFHDAIPLKFPEFTWPKSVARHPYYLKELAHYDLILANSEHSRKELETYWEWLGVKTPPPVATIPLGADFAGDDRANAQNHPLDKNKLDPRSNPLHLLMVGIMEPRKNHDVILSAMEILRTQGKNVQLSIVGRVNPHFGKPILKRIEMLIRRGLPIRYHRQIEDHELVDLYQKADLTLFPSVVEGNGLPIIESLWRGIPTIASPIPPHLEHAQHGKGILIVDPMDATHLASTLDRLIDHPKQLKALQTAVFSHALPTWQDSADATLQALDRLSS